MKRPTVIIRACADYDSQRIRAIVRDGLDTLDLRPHGRTLVKPNVVASGQHFPHAHTRPEFLEGVLRALRDRARDDLEELALGERCGITVPTRFAFRGAGIYEMADRIGDVKLYHFEETSQVEVPLYHEGRLRGSLYTPEPVARADFFVNCPKFKAHPWTTVTFSMKNYIGIQDDRHRLIDHDHRLNEKVADLQYVIQPQFIAIDAITAGEGRMLTPIPFDLGLVIMGDNQVAFDAVCCHIIGLDPLSVDHIRMVHERGFGPVDLDAIDVVGDVTLEEAQKKAAGFRVGLIRVEEYFQGSSIKAVSGPPPRDDHGDPHGYCWGGCPGALEEAIEILRLYDASTDDKMPPLHIVFGKYEGELDVKPGEKVIFIGDCAEYHGPVGDDVVHIESRYVDRSRLDPLEAEHQDIFAKMATTGLRLRALKKDDHMVLDGCPVSVAEQVLALVHLSGAKNPYLDLKDAVPFTHAYFSTRTRNAIRRILGHSYNKPGATPRGDARPAQNLPPEGHPAPLEHR